ADLGSHQEGDLAQAPLSVPRPQRAVRYGVLRDPAQSRRRARRADRAVAGRVRGAEGPKGGQRCFFEPWTLEPLDPSARTLGPFRLPIDWAIAVFFSDQVRWRRGTASR